MLATACGTKKTPGESLCVAMVPPPAACSTTCDPALGSPNACPGGFHCTADGKCDISCTQTGNECGTGFMCTAAGSCISDGVDAGVIIDAPACPAVHLTAKKVVPTVALLLDQSGSMTQTYPDPKNPNDPRRWDALRKALIDPTNGVVKKLQGSVAFGATLYSGPDAGGCPVLTPNVQKPRVINNFATIDQLLKAEPAQNTPTAPSIDALIADFAAHPPAQGSPPIIVLATDGLPDTCEDRNPTKGAAQDAANATSVAAAQRAYAAGIRLFFLFIGGEDAGTHPKQMANAGAGKDPVTGDEVPFIATNPAALTAAFNTIIGGVVSCELKLSGSVSAADAPNGIVKLNGTTLVYNTDWTLDPDGLTLRLVGGACTTLKAAANPTVDAEFPCGTIIF